jgi:hypothetical protein
MTKARGEFELASWNEDTYEELEDGGKLTRASVTQTFTGDVTGDGSVEWLMCYGADGTARFVGLQYVRGVVGDNKGSFVLETEGEFDGKTAFWSASVVPGSGRGELTGMTGTAKFSAPRGSKAEFALDYKLA